MEPRPLEHLIDDRPDEGIFRVHRDVFRSGEIT
jgi:hypothetical protein